MLMLLLIGLLWPPPILATRLPTAGDDVITPTHKVFLPIIEHSPPLPPSPTPTPSPSPTPPSMLVSHGQGFDTCAAPTTAQLAAWKQAGPYEYLGIYLGGSMHYAPCRSYNETHQTPQWLTAVREQGWQFIPTWVGPQAPCTLFSDRLSNDPAIARTEGTIEAQKAITAATALGLYSPLIIYYDMENYNVNDATCHTATNAFLTGWIEEMHNQEHQAGIYGGVTAVNDWYMLEHVPDSTWIARYIRTDYDPFITVDLLNQGYINPPYWDEHRLFQYSGSHNESWDGVVMNIDNNVAAGLVALSGEPTNLLREATLLTPDTGWLWQSEQLYLTRNGGGQWQNITPAQADALLGVYFWNETYGWLTGIDAPTGQPASVAHYHRRGKLATVARPAHH